MTGPARRPTILVTNDDGFDAPGIAVLSEAMEPVGQVYVVAPDREQSAMSHALTVHRPLRVMRSAEGRYRVDGTPTDCVHLAVTRLTGGVVPDLVVSGINRGLNIGDDVTYSGTVAGALEGSLLHIPSIAFSAEVDADGRVDHERSRGFIEHIARLVLERGLPQRILLNVNFPAAQPKGVRVTRQGTRTYRATALERKDPAGRPYFWIDQADAVPTGELDGDHLALDQGYVSVSPLHANLTHDGSLEAIAEWQLDWK